MTALAEHGIHLPRPRSGWQNLACPECARTKRRPGDDTLGVNARPDGSYYWNCKRCGWKGNAAGASSSTSWSPRSVRAQPAPTQRPSTGLPEALALYRSAAPILADTSAASYLTARGCALPHPDGDLRYLLDHRHPSGWRGTCLLALVTDAATGEPMTLHRTWVQPDGNKAPIDKPRLLWPGLRKAGGVVRLWPDDAVTLGLCVAEGIETALTAAAGFGLAWACIDAGNLAALPVLPAIDSLTIIADHDALNRQTGVRAGSAAANQCGQRWLAAGAEVRVWVAPAEGTDLNDLARAGVSC
jgi:putative DNA primase/helicase